MPATCHKAKKWQSGDQYDCFQLLKTLAGTNIPPINILKVKLKNSPLQIHNNQNRTAPEFFHLTSLQSFLKSSACCVMVKITLSFDFEF